MDPAEREHVTPLIYRRRRALPARGIAPGPAARPRAMDGVDTPVVLDHVRDVVAQLGVRTDLSWQEILDLLGESPPPESPLQILRAR